MRPFFSNTTKITAIVFAVIISASNLNAQNGKLPNRKFNRAEQKIEQLTHFIEESLIFKAPSNDYAIPTLTGYTNKPSSSLSKSEDKKPKSVKGLKTSKTSEIVSIKDVETFCNWFDNKLTSQLSELNRNGSGKVVVGFAVDQNGNLTNIKIISSDDLEVNKIVLDILCDCPKWIIQQVQSQPYKLYYSIPIEYSVK